MQIRKRLTALLVGIFVLILLCSFIAIYLSSEHYRNEDFLSRLSKKATNTAQLLLQVDEIDSTLLQRIEKNNPISLPEEEIFIFDYNDKILYSSQEQLPNYIGDSLLNEIRLGGEIDFEWGKREVLGFLFVSTYDRFVVITSAVDVYGRKKVANLLWVLLMVFCITILLVAIAAWIFTTRAMAPIWTIIDQANQISINSLNLRLDPGNNEDELAKLAQSFNQTLDRLERAFKVQKNFIANASHEIRTPLTIITGQLEVLMMKSRTPEEYHEKLQSILEDMKGLNKMSNKLLLLAQTSAERPTEEDTAVRIDEIIWSLKADMEKRIGNKVFVSFENNIDDEHKLSVIGNEQLLRIAFSNLLENGLKYSENRSCKITIGSVQNRLKIAFQDEGIGIPTSDLQHIFEPFTRAQNATQFAKGNGIGLSLVKQILGSHNGQIKVYSEVNKGSLFEVTIPSVPKL